MTARQESPQQPTPVHIHHYRWDLDKTYIRTEFDTVRQLVQTFLQDAEDKHSFPGAATLLRTLLTQVDDGPARRVTFISGSPQQMRRVLTRKLQLDGIQPDQFLLKPNLSNLLRLRFRAIRSQIGYKLDALFTSRLPTPAGTTVDEFLFGDDAEQDALIYSLYADVLAGRVPAATVEWLMRHANIHPAEQKSVLDAVRDWQPDGRTRIRRIFIHLARRSPTSRFHLYGARVVPIFNWFQAAVVLHGMDELGDADLFGMAATMGQEGYTPARLANSLHDIVRRGFVEPLHLAQLELLLQRWATQPQEQSSLFVQAFASTALPLHPPVDGPAAWLSQIDWTRARADAHKYRPARLQLPRIGFLD